jgi:serine/threonine protein kinase
MVQGELNTAQKTSAQAGGSNSNNSGNAQNTINMKLYENLAANEDTGEKKKKVGNYIISKTIGEGSFAKVRLGYHLITQQMVAVKVINKREVLKRNYLRANLRREACMMQRMQHPHIIQLYEVMETENCYYIVMELIDGIEFVKYLSKK